MVLRALLSFIFSLLLASAAFAGGASYDVVFDIDWTLFYPTKTLATTDGVQVGEESYRMADGVLKIISDLHTQGHRVSLFSGGKKERNAALAQYLLQRLQAQGLRDFSFYKVLNFENLTPRPGAPAGAKFSERLMKDLSLVNTDLSRVVLVDDMPKFAVLGQERNVFFLGKTYVFYENFDSSLHGEFDPPTKTEWQRERSKIQNFYDLFQSAIHSASGVEALDLLQAMNDGRGLCSKVFAH